MSAETAPAVRVVLRDMSADDLVAVRRVERAAYPDAWSRRVFESELRNGFARYLVAIEDGAEGGGALNAQRRGWRRRLLGPGGPPIVGFVGVWFMVDQLHVATIAVDPSREGEGLGARLLLACFELAYEAELAMIALEVRVSNDRARALYERHGFSVAGRLTGYYSDDGEDALVMTSPPLREPSTRARVDALRGRHRARFPWTWPDA
jgi:ribosomal-protein-alanine N-acetyltransferase